ncbi:hypothetical protein RHMOL_Rhmol12G0096700 [Rhododendron molle]|uniref:Uncharacterized protein n=1 Tax=Rhododendron molle TaxID=49168 RepID=A0ACC0LHD6_RHOML|nr:hypothetical protein RHMOL_Rhmol12G0096700 [Rhododendron molle]
MVLKENLGIMGIVEAKVRAENMVKVVQHCFPLHWRSLHNLGSCVAARIVLEWDSQKFDVVLFQSSSQLLVVFVRDIVDDRRFYLFVVYGSTSMIERRVLWSEMRYAFAVIGSSAWIQLGDFNIVRSASERLVGYAAAASDEFNSCLTDIEQDDMPSKGLWFTWSNKRNGLGDNKSILDRVLINSNWLNLFPNNEAVVQPPGISDHCPIMVSIAFNIAQKRSFKFFNFWMANPKFSEVLKTSWAAVVQESPMFVLSVKLKRLKGVLREFNKKSYSGISSRVQMARAELTRVQERCFTNPFDATLGLLEKEKMKIFMELSLVEESFLKQKSRVKWLGLGDKNTRFFFHKMCI